MHGVMDMGWLLFGIQVLHVLGYDDAGHSALGNRNAHGAVDQVAHLHCIGTGLYVLVRHVFEQVLQIDFLLVAAAKGRTSRLTHNGNYGLVVHLGIIESIQKMNSSWPRCRHAETYLACKFGVSAGHESGHLLVAYLDEIEQIFVTV